jgi:hypothetical protein
VGETSQAAKELIEMPWVRIDENAMQHPKLAALSDGAFRLWVEALTYCQKYLTDGAVSAMASRGLHAFTSKRRHELITVGLWKMTIDWNESRDHIASARQQARERRRRYQQRHASANASRDASPAASQTPNVLIGVGVRELRDAFDEREGGVGETSLTARAGVFCEWYADKHAELFGVGYMGTNADFVKAQELCKRFSDDDLRDAALVWFGQNDDFAMRGTRTIPKFASRATGCLQTARRVSA